MKKHQSKLVLALLLAMFVGVVLVCAHQLGLVKRQSERVVRRAKEYEHYLGLEEPATASRQGINTFDSEGICEGLQQDWATGMSLARYSPEIINPPRRTSPR